MSAGRRPARQSKIGPARAGSQLQLQLWVNQHQVELNGLLAGQVPALAELGVAWTSHLARDPAGAFAEYQDANFLDAIGQRDLAGKLAEFWPSGGPVWDGLATTRGVNGSGVLLIEAKAHVPELLDGAPCDAKTPESIAKIDYALEQTRNAFGATGELAEWKGPLYQTANRLAHLHFLRSNGVPGAVFTHVLFVGDGTLAPTSQPEFESALDEVSRVLGLTDNVPGAAHAFLPALEKPGDWPA